MSSLIFQIKLLKTSAQADASQNQTTTINNKPKPYLPHYVYIITNKNDTTIYVGETGNIKNRISQHKRKVHPSTFSAKYNLNKLVYFEALPSRKEGLIREKRLKKWNRNWKIRIIEEKNPEWIDLSSDWDLGFKMMEIEINI